MWEYNGKGSKNISLIYSMVLFYHFYEIDGRNRNRKIPKQLIWETNYWRLNIRKNLLVG